MMTDRSMSTGSSGSNNSTQRQSSQTSLFEQLASQAKDLVRESTRQSSQEKLLAQMDKVLYYKRNLRKLIVTKCV
jgi:hypothetical protein